MATYAYTFNSGDNVTPERLNNARTVSDIVNADIKSDAAIAGTKIAPDFGSQNIAFSGADRSITNTGNFALIFGTNNTERLRIDNAGNVGIGTTSSARPLEITNNGSCSLGLTDTSTGGATLAFSPPQNSNGFAQIDVSGVNALRISTNSGERMRIDASGNVGIGTTTLTHKINVNGDAGVTGQVFCSKDINGQGNGQLRLAGASNTSKQIWLGIDTTNNIGVLQAYLQGTGAYPIAINPLGGNVGIGTASSARPLEITNNGSCSLGLTDTSTGGATLAFSPPQNSNGFGQIDVSGANALRISTNSGERMRIDASGNVGIATISPSSRLHVAGDLTLSSATTAASANAGAETLPANPVGFLVVSINGTSRKIPYYAT